LVAGRPGAGKGVQGVRLARRLGVQYISTGDLLRTEIAAGSALGGAVERLVAAGRLIPSGLITAIVESNLDGHGYVLDGFPRTVSQAEALFAQPALAPSIALEIVVSERVALGRLGRRARPDDDPAVVRARLASYEAETVPTLEWLDHRILVLRVDGHNAPDAVERNIWTELKRAGRVRQGSSLSDAWAIASRRNDATARGAAYAGE
jgi:adenylate kinase